MAAQLKAAGLGAEVEHAGDLLPAYENQLAGVDRIAALDLSGLEPAFVLALPDMNPPAAEQQR